MKSLVRPTLGKRLFRRLLRPRSSSLVVARKAMPGYTGLVRPLVWHAWRPVHTAPPEAAGQANLQNDWVPDDGLSSILRGHQESRPSSSSNPPPVQRSTARADQQPAKPVPSPKPQQSARPAEGRVQRAPASEPPRQQPAGDHDDAGEHIPSFLRGRQQDKPQAAAPKTPAPAQPRPIQRAPASATPAASPVDDLTGKTQPLRVQRKPVEPGSKPLVKTMVEEIKRPAPQKPVEHPAPPPAAAPVQRAAAQDVPTQIVPPRQPPELPSKPTEGGNEKTLPLQTSSSPELEAATRITQPAKPQPAVEPQQPPDQEGGSEQHDENLITSTLVDSLAETQPVRPVPDNLPPRPPLPMGDPELPASPVDSSSQPTVRMPRPQPRSEPESRPSVEQPPASQEADTQSVSQSTMEPVAPAAARNLPEPKPLAAAKPLILAQPLRAAQPMGPVQRKEASPTDPLAFWSAPQRRELPLAPAARPMPGAKAQPGATPPLSSVVQRATQNNAVPQAAVPPSGRPGSLSTPSANGPAAQSEPAPTQAASQPAGGQQAENQPGAPTSLDEMARQVYGLLRRRLQVEQERAHGRS